MTHTWISVKERLPEPNKPVLVMREDIPKWFAIADITQIPMADLGHGNQWHILWSVPGTQYTSSITHWMEIPRP